MDPNLVYHSFQFVSVQEVLIVSRLIPGTQLPRVVANTVYVKELCTGVNE